MNLKESHAMNARIETPVIEVPSALADQPIGQIAVALPGATAIFRRLKLDFCCGGQISLRQAATDKALDLPALLGELAALDRSDAPPPAGTSPELIDHILTRFHAVHRVQLPELIRMARRVEAVHRDHPAVPTGLADLLEQAQEELLDHMEKEEQIIFPNLRAGGTAMIAYPIGIMRQEHTSHGEMLEHLMGMTHDATPPDGACNTWRALYAGIAQLHDDLINHIHLENNVLFPRFEPQPMVQAGCGSGGGCGCAG
jgi:regulator of cell morphogenesis and NO signaling